MSRERLLEHRRIWEGKPALARVYGVWFDALLASLPAEGRVLEVGAGPGFLAAYARGRRPRSTWLASDLLPAPWNDLAADALRLPLRKGAVDAVAGLDVLHHLASPAAFFVETARVLREGGRLVLVEPWVTPLSYPIYRFLHEEGCRLGIDPWRPFEAGDAKDAFEGDGALAWKIVRTTSAERWAEMGFEPPAVTVWNGFAYLLSLGFRRESLLPAWLTAPLLAVDRALVSAAPILGLRARIVWERAAR